MIAPAATWGGAVAAGNAAGAEPSQTMDAATPSFVESATLGFMAERHKRGFRSGGLVGYSTFFTGYDPQRDGLGRAISLGRGAAQATSVTARALMHTGLQHTEAGKYIAPFTKTHKYGFSGAATAMTENAYEQYTDWDQSKIMSRANSLAQSEQIAEEVTEAEVKEQLNKMEDTVEKKNASRKAGDAVKKPTKQQARQAVKQRKALKSAWSEARMRGRGGLFRFLSGLLGGKGFDETGRAIKDETYEVVDETVEAGGESFDMKFFKSKADSGGAQIMRGPTGKALGKSFRAIGALEVVNMAVDAATYAAGEGYEALVDTTERMQRRVGADQSMSAGYYNRAAQTERQRAVQTLNSNQLNPRTQIMGNEAYMNHR